jgi:murein DD-endopeptidase MepM/ murein hydrolase activator NlpD
MNLKQADLSREGIVEQRQLRGRVVPVRASYINSLKALTAVAFMLIVALAVSVFQLSKHHELQTAENSRLSTQVAQLQSQVNDNNAQLELVTAQNDSTSNKALSYIEGIQNKLSRINSYLNKRGLRSISFKAGKAVKNVPQKNAHVTLYNKYNRYLESLLDQIALMPMGYPRVSQFTSVFGYRSNPFNFGRNEFHPGLDFRGRMGEPVQCTASGRVVFAARAGGYGNCVRIRHADGIETWYGHLSRMLVREGQRVSVGQLIGKVGSTGRSTGPHLHYEVRRNGKAVNPKQYLSLN